ncbi:bifunctional protein FolC [bacterium BMS3Abin04]|nr:bifunctional protein FolC [bacterium BMS3Abin04]
MNIETALNKLFSLHQFGVKLGLENITNLLNFIGNPQKALNIFHIAGSNGKGSTASFLSSILMEAGYKVGQFTSPHFVRFNERIRVNGIEIPDECVADFMEKLDPYIIEFQPTFFELTTALAFKYFAESKVDFVVLETGLGGRLDATNTVIPLASVITTISLEHSHILGNSLQKIAFEKGGIIKKDVPVFIGLLPSESEQEITKMASEKNSRGFKLDDNIITGKDYVSVKSGGKKISLYAAPLKGYHQLLNAALAILTACEIISEITIKNILDGIDNVITNSGISGRYEIYRQRPRIIFDSAHNPGGIDSFVNEFKKEWAKYRSRILIFAAMKDKNTLVMIKKLKDYFDKIYFTNINYKRAATPEQLIEIAGKTNVSAEKLIDKTGFVKNFKNNYSKNDCLVVIGSIYLLGEIKTGLSG